MTGRRPWLEWGEQAAKLFLLGVLLYPLLPDSRTRWWLLMRASQEGARRLGTVALVAENHYRQEIA